MKRKKNSAIKFTLKFVKDKKENRRNVIVNITHAQTGKNVQEETSNINISNTLKELHLQAKGNFALK